MKTAQILPYLATITAAFPSANLQPRAACSGNTASDRSVWCDYSTSTDYYNVIPDTGVTREYWFELTDVTIAPDGVSRVAMAVNGTVPGPTIIADWGDTVTVHVTNKLTTSMNGSSIHFHGIRQNYTNQADGVTSVTQCPTPPGSTEIYTWRATQYGSSWYHSHFALQAFEGIFGGIIINGPATANYDYDLGNLMLLDWSHQTADELYDDAQLNGPVTMDTGLINGTNVYGSDGSTTQTGYRFNTTFTSGSSYLLRLVNTAIDTHFKFSIDNHTMKVIAADFVPIVPYTTTTLAIGMGQRYDVIVTADQSSVASDFWMRAIPQVACSESDNVDGIKGIIHYGSSTGTPTTTGHSYTDECLDELSTNIVPYLSKTVGAVTITDDEAVSVTTNSDNFFRWTMNATSMLINWENPTLLQQYNGVAASEFSNTSHLIDLPNAGEWVYVVITEPSIPVAHPIHLHGHDFYVVASGTGTYDSSTVTLNLSNPPRRDVATLPASGYLVLAFETDNPGAWLMHCHIGWHTLEGFALQFLEQSALIDSMALIDYDALNSTCSAWNTYTAANAIVQTDDSGI
ncbi:hypothetical protein Vi05172_g3726 [Venturia inaequalis]|nr:hypothetical protein Vi05172_g3726 [Venturia inaequalis]